MMKVIKEKRRAYYIVPSGERAGLLLLLLRYQYFHYYQLIDSSDGRLFVHEGIIRPVYSVSALTWFIR